MDSPKELLFKLNSTLIQYLSAAIGIRDGYLGICSIAFQQVYKFSARNTLDAIGRDNGFTFFCSRTKCSEKIIPSIIEVASIISPKTPFGRVTYRRSP